MMAWALAALLTAGCSSPPTAPATPVAPASVTPEAMDATTPASSASQPVEPAAQETAAASPTTPVAASADSEHETNTQVDAAALPEDVREYIVKQRMCRHLKAKADSGEGSPQVAAMICATAGDAAWKALIRKYQGDDTIGSVLLAERPLDSAEPAQP